MKPRSYTSQPRNSLTRQISGDRTWMSAGLGVAAGLAAAVGVLSARKLIRTWPCDTRHPLKHRMLDMASGLLQRKIPLEPINTRPIYSVISTWCALLFRT